MLESEAQRRTAATLARLKPLLDQGAQVPAHAFGVSDEEALKLDEEEFLDALQDASQPEGKRYLLANLKNEGRILAHLWETRERGLWERIVEDVRNKLPAWSSEFIKWGLVFLAGFGLRWISSP